ncbi:ATP-dependent RNA helicase DHX30-like isoform X1 [Leptidea sinapis]|uniref:ATP-dependent RNA helicase DHX30-like isoform X1 n=2 Tax=Leptidea sinapis TaxID=189913 RepID=UPI00212BF5C9|nr:ATP-dependent RNA helicase DHX30-like isoform X1 [Leptidea sinapis]
MFLRKILLSSSLYYSQRGAQILNICRLCSNYDHIRLRGPQHQRYLSYLVHKKYYSKSLDNNLLKDETSQSEKELNNIKQLFSSPRVTLNELATKIPDKMFDVQYKQTQVLIKGSKKKVAQNDWSCTYLFLWPEKMKFESSAVSKRQAAEKAAIQALHWLYISGRIDKQGNPIYKQDVLEQIRSTLNTPLHITISEKSIERIDKIWNEYQGGIKNVYESTLKEASERSYNFPIAVQKDSTIDDVDGCEGLIENADETSTPDFRTQAHPVFGKTIEPPSLTALSRRERNLQATFERYDETLTPLPIDEYADQINSTISESRVAVIVGAAGCGKSTRVPAAILRHCGARSTILVSEPRRVAAVGLAQRVADELAEGVGETVGYQVRLHSRCPRPPGGAILYCTSGVLLRRLQFNPGLSGCSHVLIDEAHERDVNTDVTLLLLRRALYLNPNLNIVVMSATLDTQVFTKYFNDCPVIEVPGRTFPIQESYIDDLESKFKIKLPHAKENCMKIDGKPMIDCQEVAELIKAVDRNGTDGAILVFLPGWAEIKQTKQTLDEIYSKSNLHVILPVHSRLSTTEQAKMFSKPAPGIRKIVLSTNIAETSVTIPDAVHVIDTGAHKENTLKQGSGTASLETVWVSKAGAKQRSGRAGRVQPGFCYKMYTKEKEEGFTPYTTPEILRVPLDQTVLDCKSYAPDEKAESFLSQLPQPPSKNAVRFAVNDLIDLGALSNTERLTRVGRLITSLKMSPRLARAVLHAAIIGNILAATNVATMCGDNVEIFHNPADRREEIRSIKRKFNETSDHAALHWIQEEYERKLEGDQPGDFSEVESWCRNLGLRKERLAFVKSLSNLHLQNVLGCGLLEEKPDVEELNRYSDIDELTSAVLLSGSNSLLSTRKYVRTKGKLRTTVELYTTGGERAHVGSDSVNHNVTKNHHPALLTYCGGYHSPERRALVLYNTSRLTPHAVLLFSMGHVYDTKSNEEDATADLYVQRHKLKMEIPRSQVSHMLQIREMLWKTLEYNLERDVRSISYDELSDTSAFKKKLIKTVARILVEANTDYIENNKRDADVR